MSAIPHIFVAQLTNQSYGVNTAWADVSGVAISATDLSNAGISAGDNILILATAQLGGASNTVFFGAKIVHGTTEFAESVDSRNANTGSTRRTYRWFSVWTVVASEGLKMQFRTGSGSGFEVQIDQCFLAVIKIDDLVENTDWFYAERATDDALSTAFTTGASVTFTPGTAGHDWLVLAIARFSTTSSTTSTISRINRSGEAAETVPSWTLEMSESISALLGACSRVFNLGSSSNTFAEAAATSSGTAHTRLHSQIFALNLNKFAQHSNAYTEADVALSATNYATALQTLAITPGVLGDVLLGSYFGFDKQNTARVAEFRVQVDNSDAPAGQTTDNYQFYSGNDANDEVPFSLDTMIELNAAEHAIDLDGSADSVTNTPTAQHRSLWAFTMELAGAANITPTPGAAILTGIAGRMDFGIITQTEVNP